MRLDVPWADLTPEERQFVIEGDDEYDGIRGFFRWLERKKYKVHVRVFLSRYRGYLACPDCGGARLRREARDVRVGGRTIDVVSALTVREAQQFFTDLQLTEKETVVADKVLKEIRRRLSFLSDVGLDYLTLDRLSSTLSGGEAQRINLATSLGSALVGTLYVLDEPSIGLHSRDNERLLKILRQLRDQGNTVLVVEHDEDMIRVADHIVDIGLGAGEQGGRVVYSGDLAGLMQEPRSLTAKYLRNELAIPVPTPRRRGTGQKLGCNGATEHNLKNIDVDIPLNTLTCVTGVSGSGKSTLVHDVLYAAIKRAKGDWDRRVGVFRALEGLEYITDVVLVDQAPIGRTPRSNPVTYLKAFDPIRELFASDEGRAGARADGEPLLVQRAGRTLRGVPGRRRGARRDAVPRRRVRAVRALRRHAVQAAGARGPLQGQERPPGARHDGARGARPSSARRRRCCAGCRCSTRSASATCVSGSRRRRCRAGKRSGSRLPRTWRRSEASACSTSSTNRRPACTSTTSRSCWPRSASWSRPATRCSSSSTTSTSIKTADYIIDLGPEGGEAGGRVVVTGTPEQVAQDEESHTGRVLRQVLASGRTNAYAAR